MALFSPCITIVLDKKYVNYLKTQLNFLYGQILPVSIKSLGGSIATLAAWLTSFAITMTANLMLTWSVGGSQFYSMLLLTRNRIMNHDT